MSTPIAFLHMFSAEVSRLRRGCHHCRVLEDRWQNQEGFIYDNDDEPCNKSFYYHRNMINLSFCDRYSYHSQIRKQFTRMLSVMDSSKIRSVLLYGSTSTGEIGVKVSDDGVELYSDYEFVIVARGIVNKKYKKKLSQHFAVLEKEFSDNPLFKIDFSYINARSLRKGLKSISAANWSNAVVVFGEDVKPLMPAFNPDNLNKQFHNEILLWALWTNILFFPIEILDNKTVSEKKYSWWKYILCKNCLQIPSWLLPLEGVFLTSYKEKINYIDEYYHTLRLSQFFDEAFKKVLNECYSGKTRLEFRNNSVGLYKQVVHYYLAAKRYLLSLYGHPADDLFSNSRGVFFIDNYSPRVMYDIYLLIFKADRLDFKKALGWLSGSKYGLMMDFLFDMNLALLFSLDHRDEESKRYAGKACEKLNKLILNKSLYFPDELFSFPETWVFLRNSFAEFLGMYVPSLRLFNNKVLEMNSL